MRVGGWKAAAPPLVWLALGLVPTPPGLPPNAWSYFALFAVVVVGLILEPIPAAAIGLVGVLPEQTHILTQLNYLLVTLQQI